MLKRKITCISILFIGCGITYFYLDTKNSIQNTIRNNIEIEAYYNNKPGSINTTRYISILEIPSINFKRGLYEINDPLSKLDNNIIFLDKSDMPDKKNSMVIIVGHSGDTSNSYFKGLFKLKYNDLIYLDYDGYKYKYKITDIYEIKKNGNLAIESNKDKRTIALVTCKGNKKQLVIIGTQEKEN